jgi:hypothetical protein
MDVIETCASGVFAHSGQYSLTKGEVDFVYMLFLTVLGFELWALSLQNRCSTS